MSIIVGQSILFILDLLTMTSNMIKRVKLRVCFSRRGSPTNLVAFMQVTSNPRILSDGYNFSPRYEPL